MIINGFKKAGKPKAMAQKASREKSSEWIETTQKRKNKVVGDARPILRVLWGNRRSGFRSRPQSTASKKDKQTKLGDNDTRAFNTIEKWERKPVQFASRLCKLSCSKDTNRNGLSLNGEE
jgi:hypothetical protein